jgi:hypothetical protein
VLMNRSSPAAQEPRGAGAAARFKRNLATRPCGGAIATDLVRAADAETALEPGDLMIVTVDASGTVTWSWRAAEHLDPARYPLQPQALRVAGELADGTLPYLAGPRCLASLIVPAIITTTTTAAAAGIGRDDLARHLGVTGLPAADPGPGALRGGHPSRPGDVRRCRSYPVAAGAPGIAALACRSPGRCPPPRGRFGAVLSFGPFIGMPPVSKCDRTASARVAAVVLDFFAVDN